MKLTIEVDSMDELERIMAKLGEGANMLGNTIHLTQPYRYQPWIPNERMEVTC